MWPPLVSMAVAACVVAVVRYCHGWRLSPDGHQYIRAVAGEPVPVPFHLRFLLPLVLRARPWAWIAASYASLVLAAGAVALLGLAHGLSATSAAVAGCLFAGLPLVRVTASLPVLVDGPAILAVAVSALLAVQGHPLPAVLVALVGAGIKETVPVFAALASMSPWPLLALVVPLVRRFAPAPGPAEDACVASPVSYAREKQCRRLLHAPLMLAPWGAALAGLVALTPAAVLSLAVSYSLLFVTADSTRVYQFGGIPLCICAASVIPEYLAVPVVAFHLWNPWQGEV